MCISASYWLYLIRDVPIIRYTIISDADILFFTISVIDTTGPETPDSRYNYRNSEQNNNTCQLVVNYLLKGF